MRRLLIPLLVLCLFALRLEAQTASPEFGDPPVLSRIEVSAPDRFGQMTMTGAAGAVFPNAYVIVRNLYSGDTVYTRAGVTGAFSAQLIGTVNTPYWISPSAQQTPVDRRADNGSVPGGPGAILYPTASVNSAPEAITRLAIDGDRSEWINYPQAQRFAVTVGDITVLRNNESLYLTLTRPNIASIALGVSGQQINLNLTIDGVTYQLRFDPVAETAAQLVRVNPNARELDPLILARRVGTDLEVRVPLNFTQRTDIVQLESLSWLDASGSEIVTAFVGELIPKIDEIDGIVRVASRLGNDIERFTVGGSLNADGTSNTRALWDAQGRTGTINLAAGDEWSLELDVALQGVALAAETQIVAELSYQPITQQREGELRATSGGLSNNGWSHILTPSGIPVDGQSSSVLIGSAITEAYQVVRRTDTVSYPIDFVGQIPRDLPPGLYVPVLRGYLQTGDQRIRWDQPEGITLTRLPLVVSVGGITEAVLPMALFIDDPVDGNRGTLPEGFSDTAGLSNRVRFNSPLLVLPPFTNTAPREPIRYALEPYLPNLMPNLYDVSGTPLIPFDLPGGRLSVIIEAPDGQTTDLGVASFLQNQLSTTADDEQAVFGVSSPVDTFRLTTLEPRFTDHIFSAYGDHTITLTATVPDAWGRSYQGGGVYHVLIAEPIDLTPGVLPGTPFVVGDAFNAGVKISPAFAATVTMRMRFYPVSGAPMIEQVIEGIANDNGYFQPGDAAFIFPEAGEYVIDYEARYQNIDNTLWATALRSAGVVAPASTPLGDSVIAHGARGAQAVEPRPAWFNLARYAQLVGVDVDALRLTMPYYSGDVLWTTDGVEGVLQPVITLQDQAGAYADQVLAAASADGEGARSDAARTAIARDEIPITGRGNYFYISATRPNVTVRQFVSAGDSNNLATAWNNDDPLNRQIGAGINGVVPDDIVFLFGGAVLHGMGEDETSGDAPTTAGYAAAAIVISAEAVPGERIYPPGRGSDGGADGGTLVTYLDIDYDMVIVPTGLEPGDVFAVGEALTFSGQVAPTLPATVRVTYTSPSGVAQTFENTANSFGYFFDPTARLVITEAGVWTAQVTVSYAGRTSAGVIEAPGISGGILGLEDGRFEFYALTNEAQAESISWNNATTDALIAIGLPYNFNFTLPVGWTNIDAKLIMTTPGYVLVETPLRVSGRSFSYQYSAAELGRQVSILETDTRTRGSWVSDVRTLTFVAVGTDAQGQPALRSRTFTLFHDRLVTSP